jgi:hypothetical protein
MRTGCKQCDSALGTEDIDRNRLVGTCPACGAVFDLSHQLADGSTQQRRRAPVPLPRGLSVLEESAPAAAAGQAAEPGRLAVVHRWFRPVMHPLLLLFAAAWNGALVLALLRPELSGVVAHASPLSSLLFVAVGVLLGYAALVGLLNRTRIEVDGATLSVRHVPLPWRGTHRFAPDQLKQLYCEPEILRGESSRTVFHLGAVDGLGRKTRLLSDLGSADQVLYLEQRIEERLGIADVEVEGGVLRPAAAVS